MLYTKGWVDIAKITTPNIVNYCRKHNYSWNIQCIDEPYDAFEKIRQIQGIFERNEADAVFSMDCDAIITNYGIELDGLVAMDDSHAYFTQDYNGLNCGVFCVKKSEWSKCFLKKILDKKGQQNMHCEQDAIMSILCEEFPAEVLIVPQYAFNSYKYELYIEIPPQTEEEGQWVEGESFVLHLPGIGMDLRKQILSNTKVIYE